jgi:hypothetical protein
MKKNSPTSWKPGQSGNPGGRPKVSAEVRELAREHGPEAILRLVALMNSKNESVAVRASDAILDRGFGRPMQAMELASKEGEPNEGPPIDWSKLSNEEWESFKQAHTIMKQLREVCNVRSGQT